MYWSRSARASGSVGSVTSSAAGANSRRRVRARCSVLLTAVVVVPSMTATSTARKDSTSRRMSTARCVPDRYCRLATSASRRSSRASDDGRGIGRVQAHECVGNRLKPRDIRSGRHRGGLGVRFRTAEAGRAAHDGCGAPARSGRRWWRSGTARYAPMTGPRTRRRSARLADTSPGPDPLRRPPSRACGSNAPATPAGTARCPGRTSRCRGTTVPRPIPSAGQVCSPGHIERPRKAASRSAGHAPAGASTMGPKRAYALGSTIGVEDLDPGLDE